MPRETTRHGELLHGVVGGCALGAGVAVVTRDEPPRDVWQLCERAVNMVPLTVAKMETLLDTPMVEDPQTPGRFEGGPRRLAPSLSVTSSVIAIRDGAWLFAAINIEPPPCISVDMVKAHYPSVELKYGPTGHSVYETFGWEVRYHWGALRFGIRVKGLFRKWSAGDGGDCWLVRVVSVS